MHWQLPGRQLHLGRRRYLAIINLTPDSFSDGGAFPSPGHAIAHGEELLRQGAHILDIGAESTRPGSKPVGHQEQWARMAPVLGQLKKNNRDCILSIDTRSPEVARLALDAGADIINDVTGFQNPKMLEAAKKNCGLIAMRSRTDGGRFLMPEYMGRPRAFQKNADAAMRELEMVRNRLLMADIEPERILLDPGFGFGTTFLEDQALWDALPTMPSVLGWPIERFCIGISRKRFVAHKYGVQGNESLDKKTNDLHSEAANMGYMVFRTHSLPGC
jgi:dihydropteroate synthase